MAELLDCRTYKLMTFDDQRYVVNELMVDLVPTSATTTSIRQAPSARRAMSEKEKFLVSGTSAVPPLQEEFKVFINLMDGNDLEDPLEFYILKGCASCTCHTCHVSHN